MGSGKECRPRRGAALSTAVGPRAANGCPPDRFSDGGPTAGVRCCPRAAPCVQLGARSLRRYALPKTDRLRSPTDYRIVSASGSRRVCDHFVILSRRNGRPSSRLGITVSKKVGHAVTRNRIKRIVRDYFRLNRGQLPEALDINVIARQTAGKLSAAAVRNSLGRCFEKITRNPR